MRVLIGCVIAVVFWTHNGFAQTRAATARTVESAALLSDPRGDSALVAAVPPGLVIEVFSRSGDWYQARTMGSVVRVGWIHRALIELLPADAGAALQSTGSAVPSPSQQGSEDVPPPPESDFSSGHIELLIGTFGGGVLVNFRGDGPVVPFLGGVIGRGFGASSLFRGLVDDPTFVNASGGVRVLTRGGGGALIVRPFYERYFNSSGIFPVSDVNRFGISLGASILF